MTDDSTNSGECLKAEGEREGERRAEQLRTKTNTNTISVCGGQTARAGRDKLATGLRFSAALVNRLVVSCAKSPFCCQSAQTIIVRLRRRYLFFLKKWSWGFSWFCGCRVFLFSIFYVGFKPPPSLGFLFLCGRRKRFKRDGGKKEKSLKSCCELLLLLFNIRVWVHFDEF